MTDAPDTITPHRPGGTPITLGVWLTAIFALLKVTGSVAITWFGVFIPLLWGVAIVLALVVLAALSALIVLALEKVRE